MSKLADKLRAMRVFNDHDLLSRFAANRKRAIAVDYIPPEGRLVRAHSSRVWSPFFQTDPNSAWYDHGHKTFVGRRSESLPKALAWATEQYGIAEWATSPFGAKIPKDAMDAASRAARDAPAERKGVTDAR